MSIAPSKKDNKRQLREGDRIADFTVVKTLGHGGYGDIYLVKSRLHPDYLTRFAMKIEYPNKDNSNTRNNNANAKNQNNSNQNDNNNKKEEKENDNKNSENDNNQKDSVNDNDNNNKNTSNDNNNNSNQANEGDKSNKENKDNNKNDENAKNNNKNKNRSLLRKSHLYIERQVLNSVQDSPYFPRYVSFGQTSIFRFLVMECFGPSLSTIRHVLPTGKYSLSSSLRIGIQMLRAIHSFHSHGFVHRDIKPSNFLIAPSLSHPIILIDFGLARVFNTEKDKLKANASGEIGLTNSNINLSALSSDQMSSYNANLLPNQNQNQNQNQNKAKFGFAGTTKYASINAHENKELGRRDDLFSWFFSLIELAAGSLPWSSLREKDEIYQAKKCADLDDFVICHSLPTQLCSIRILLESYSRTDEPDYDLIESFLDEAMRQKGSSWEDKYEWQRIDEESLSELSSISLKPPKGDRYIPNRRLPPPVLPSKKKSRRRNRDFSDEDSEAAEIEKISSKSKQRRHTSAVNIPSQSKRDRVKSTMINDQKKQTNLRHYAPQVDNQGKYSYFSSSEEKERYGHYGSEQLFSNSAGRLPSFQSMNSSSKKVAASPISPPNSNNNNTSTINDKNGSTSNRRKYVTTIKRHKNQRKRRNSDPRQPPQKPKHHSSSGALKGDQDDNDNDNKENNDNDQESEGVPLNSKGYHAVSTSNSIIFISTAHKNDDDNNNDNDNDNNGNNNNSSNSMYYTYHSYSSGDDVFNNEIINNSNNNSYYYNNSSNYTDSESDDFSFGEKHGARFASKRKNQSCPAMEPKIDRKISNEKKNNKNCLIQ